jgi:peptidoglycan/xylan/chitin deacetylase (PgdA/CDA1 family)
MTTRHLPGRFLVVAVTACAVAFLAPEGALAAPGDRPAPPPNPLVEGPWPPSKVLAVDPSTVSPPDVVSTQATSCPPATYGVQHYAPGTGKTVALTFDDGPGLHTQAIMQVLEDAGVAATFFDIGVNANVNPGMVGAQNEQLFPIGNHTWSHPDMATQPAASQAAQLDQATAQLQSITGAAPCLFRPPYGSYNSTTLNLAYARNMNVWNWSVDTEDWKAANSASSFWVNRIITRAQAGGSQAHPVILMHNAPSGDAATVAALPTIIQFYRDRGYTFVGLDGRVADRPIAGDWDGNGTITPGVVRGNTWYLRNSNASGPPDITFAYGGPSDRVVVGDWDGNGTWTPGVVRGNRWLLRNANSSGVQTVPTVTYGGPADRVITGDWDGNGTFTPGVIRGNRWYLSNNFAGVQSIPTIAYGGPNDRPIAGDWDGNGTFTPGLNRNGRWYLSNNFAGVQSIPTIAYGSGTDRPLSGDWDGDGTFTPGVARGDTFHERTTNDATGVTWRRVTLQLP